MATGIREVVALPDPIGEVLETSQFENGLVITKKRVAMGVIGIIYESRPNVTSDAAALALKSGNAVVLRSGKDAYQTAHAIVTALKKGLETTTIHPEVIQLVEDTSRESSYAMMKAKGYLDLLQGCDNSTGSLIGIFTTTKNDCITTLESQGSRIRRHIWTTFIDNTDNTHSHTFLGNKQAIFKTTCL